MQQVFLIFCPPLLVTSGVCLWHHGETLWLNGSVVSQEQSAIIPQHSPAPPRHFGTQTNRPKQNGGAGGGGIKTFKLELSHQRQ